MTSVGAGSAQVTTEAARALAAAGEQAARCGAPEALPEHLLLALLADAGSPAVRALAGLGLEPDRIARALRDRLPRAPAAERSPVPLAAATGRVIHDATREAQRLGHYQVDALHLLLALLYANDGAASATLREHGVGLVALREYVLQHPDLARRLKVRREDRLRHILRPSPVFLAVAGVSLGCGAALFLGVPERLVGLLTVLFVVSGWITSVCLHEFGHALAAFTGGDRSVRDKGYLTLDPRKYTHPLFSTIMPVVFLLLGGLGLPGGAVYIDRRALRNGWWESFTSAAGPLGTALFGLLISWPFFFGWRSWVTVENYAFWPALAYLAFLQVGALVFNLLPIPPLDGFGIIAPGLPPGLQHRADLLGNIPMLLLFMILWQDNPITDAFWRRIFDLAAALQIPTGLVFRAMDRFPF